MSRKYTIPETTVICFNCKRPLLSYSPLGRPWFRPPKIDTWDEEDGSQTDMDL